MKYLLDTHAIIWYFEDSNKLPQKVTEAIEDPQNEKYISADSLWEIVIKSGLGKLELNFSLEDLLHHIDGTDCGVLQIENEYLKILSALPSIHKDPFDRLLISSAKAEGLTILTADENVQKYDVKWVW